MFRLIRQKKEGHRFCLERMPVAVHQVYCKGNKILMSDERQKLKLEKLLAAKTKVQKIKSGFIKFQSKAKTCGKIGGN